MCLLYFSVYILRKWHRTLWRRTKKYTLPGMSINLVRMQWEREVVEKSCVYGQLRTLSRSAGAPSWRIINTSLPFFHTVSGPLATAGSNIQDRWLFVLPVMVPFMFFCLLQIDSVNTIKDPVWSPRHYD